MFDEGVRFSLGNWKINGFSAASRLTWLVVYQLNSIFDIGWCVEPMRSMPRVFLSHLHQDHSLALPTWIVWRQKFLPEIPKVYVPAACVEETIAFIQSLEKAERFQMKYQVIGLQEGDCVEIENGRVVEAFDTTHLIPTIGFLVKEKRKKLKEQYKGYSTSQIQELVRSGEDVNEEIDTPIFCYTSDTDVDLFVRRPDLLNAETLITECSHVQDYLQYDPSFDPGEMQLTHNTIAHLAPFLEKFTGKTLAFCHLPRRLEKCNILMYLMPRIPQQHREKLHLIPYSSRTEKHLFVSSKTNSNAKISPIAMETYDQNQWEKREYPGYFGSKKQQRHAVLQQKYPNYIIGYEWDGKLITRKSALQLYEDAYFAFLQQQPQILKWLIQTASDVYDCDPSNIDSQIDYFAQRPDQATHLQDIAIRRVLIRLNKWFVGKRLLEVRGMRSEGYVLNPGVVPFHKPHLIRQPQWQAEWSLPDSIESFWQSNKVILTRKN